MPSKSIYHFFLICLVSVFLSFILFLFLFFLFFLSNLFSWFFLIQHILQSFVTLLVLEENLQRAIRDDEMTTKRFIEKGKGWHVITEKILLSSFLLVLQSTSVPVTETERRKVIVSSYIINKLQWRSWWFRSPEILAVLPVNIWLTAHRIPTVMNSIVRFEFTYEIILNPTNTTFYMVQVQTTTFLTTDKFWTAAYSYFWLQNFNKDDVSGFRHGFGTVESLPLIQSIPAVSELLHYGMTNKNVAMTCNKVLNCCILRGKCTGTSFYFNVVFEQHISTQYAS